MKLKIKEFKFLKKQQRITRHNKSGDWSWEYKHAIAVLAQKLSSSGLLNGIDLELLLAMGLPWDDLVEKVPEVQVLAEQTEQECNYELSFNQCCVAMSWVHKYKPSEWKHWLD